ncbi:hypothetical protein TKK_0002906 [Trichogramma kaykai]
MAAQTNKISEDGEHSEHDGSKKINESSVPSQEEQVDYAERIVSELQGLSSSVRTVVETLAELQSKYSRMCEYLIDMKNETETANNMAQQANAMAQQANETSLTVLATVRTIEECIEASEFKNNTPVSESSSLRLENSNLASSTKLIPKENTTSSNSTNILDLSTLNSNMRIKRNYCLDSKTTFSVWLEISKIRVRLNSDKDLSFDETKNCVLQAEANATREQLAAANVAIPQENSKKCFRCDMKGHTSPNCPLVQYGQYMCYVCRRITDHHGPDCPENQNKNNSNQNSYPKRIEGEVEVRSGVVRFLLAEAEESHTRKKIQKITGVTYLTDTYERPNWILCFEARERDRVGFNRDCQARARLVSIADFSSQASNVTETDEISSPSKFGREELQKSDSVEVNEYPIKRKILDLNKTIPQSDLDYLNRNSADVNNKKSDKTPKEGML